MTVEIKITSETTADAMDEMVRLLRGKLEEMREADTADQWGRRPDGSMTTMDEALEARDEEAASEPEPNTEPAKKFRDRGEPSEGRKRRTKEEMAEDQELEKLAAFNDASFAELDQLLERYRDRDKVIEHLKVRKQAREAAASEESPQIRENPEDRKEPENETAADDAAEEDGIGLNADDGKVTIEDIRTALGKYSEKKGMPAATKLLREKLGYNNMTAVKEAGEDVWPAVHQAIAQEI